MHLLRNQSCTLFGYLSTDSGIEISCNSDILLTITLATGKVVCSHQEAL